VTNEEDREVILFEASSTWTSMPSLCYLNSAIALAKAAYLY
jgi:hypothetical protein